MFFINLIFNFFKTTIGIILYLIMLPLIIIFSFLIYFEDKANPIFSGMRVGQNFKLIKLYKLRSMLIRNNTGYQSTSANDTRILKIGKFIRATKIDELLQIINLIKGELNFVGPRPNVLDEVNKYLIIENKLLDYKPGITDFSSLHFFMQDQWVGEGDAGKTFDNFVLPTKIALRIKYVNEQSFYTDIKVLMLTAKVLLKKILGLYKDKQIDVDINS